MIPRVVHFIYFSGSRRFGAFYYLSMITAFEHLKPETVYFYTDAEPATVYFSLVKNHLRDKLIIEHISPYVSLCGQQVHALQHRADYVRLAKLQERGGVYLDLDVLCLKSFDDLLHSNHEIVMGKERDPSDPHQSLCNAVILCTPRSSFIAEWLNIYETRWTDPTIPYWFGHSTVIPMDLATKYPAKIDMRPNTDFYPFLWSDYSIFRKKGKEYPTSYCCHFFETEARKAGLIPETFASIITANASFYTLFRNYIPISPVDRFFSRRQNYDDRDLRAQLSLFLRITARMSFTELWLAYDSLTFAGGRLQNDVYCYVLLYLIDRIQKASSVEKVDTGALDELEKRIGVVARYWNCAEPF